MTLGAKGEPQGRQLVQLLMMLPCDNPYEVTTLKANCSAPVGTAYMLQELLLPRIWAGISYCH